MTNHNQKRLSGAPLTDGRLSDQRVGSNNGKIGGRSQQSNYLVSNDGVQTMDLPRNMLGPRPSGPTGRSTPLLIEPLKYIVYNNPQVVYDFLISKGYSVDNKIPSVYQFARIYVKENGEPGILELIKAAHPDKEFILKAINKEETFTVGQEPTPESGAGSGSASNGGGNGNTETTPAGKSNGSTESKTENKAEEWIKLNNKTIIIILVIVIFFLLIRGGTKA